VVKTQDFSNVQISVIFSYQWRYNLLIIIPTSLHNVIKTHKEYNLCSKYLIGILQSVYRLATGWTAEGSDFKSRLWKDFAAFHVVQTGSRAHSASYPTYTVG
jgi:hypothetical protein